jgi:hypothetical protein
MITVPPGAEPGDWGILPRDFRTENEFDPKPGPKRDGGRPAGLLRLLLASTAIVDRSRAQPDQ